MNTIFLLISGGALVLFGMITGAVLMKYGITLGNNLTLSSREEIPLGEEIITTNQEMTE